MGKPLRIAWFSPLNTGEIKSDSVAAYTTDLLVPELLRYIEIDLYHDRFVDSSLAPTFHYLSAASRHQEKPYDLFFYQLEDKPCASFSRIHMAAIPGVVLFHDLFFTSFGPEPILNSPWHEIVQRFNQSEVEWWDRDAIHDQHGPLGFREAAMAALPIFTDPRAHAEFSRLITERLIPGGSSYTLSYPVRIPNRLQSTKPHTVAFCGSPRIEHRAHKLLSALRELPQMKLIWLLDTREKVRAEELIAEFELSSVELSEGRSPDMWSKIVGDVSVAVHPLFSVFGQVEPYLSISRCAGVPCIVTRFGSSEYLPDSATIKIEPGEHEAHAMKAALKTITGESNRSLRGQISREACSLYDSKAVAHELLFILQRAREILKEPLVRWAALEQSAKEQILREAIPEQLGDDMLAYEARALITNELSKILPR